MRYHRFQTEWGAISTVVADDRLLLLSLPGAEEVSVKERAIKLTGSKRFEAAGEMNFEVESQIKAFLDGTINRFDLPLRITGGAVHQEILKQVARIPYGQTLSYGEVATRVGHPGAARVVGTAMATNPLPLVIPCHRVLAANGLGGYGGGLEMKKRLLRLEGALTENIELL